MSDLQGAQAALLVRDGSGLSLRVLAVQVPTKSRSRIDNASGAASPSPSGAKEVQGL